MGGGPPTPRTPAGRLRRGLPCQDGRRSGHAGEERAISQDPPPWAVPDGDGKDDVPPPSQPWGQPPAYGQPTPGQAPPGHGPPPGYGQPPPGYGQPQYGQPQYGQPQYGQPPYGQPPPPGAPSPWGPPPAPGSGPGWGPPPNGAWAPPRGAGLIPLRPLTVGEIYDGAMRAIRGNPRTMVGFSAAVIAVLSLLALVPQAVAITSLMGSDLLDPAADPEDVDLSQVGDVVSGLGLTAIVSGVEYLLATVLVSSLMIVAVDAAVRGRVAGPGELVPRIRRRLPALLGLALLVALTGPVIVGVSAVPGAVLLVAGLGVAGGVLLGVGLLIGVLAAIAFVAGYWTVAAPALLLEDLGVIAALRRSFRLVRRSFWRVFGIGLLTAIIVAIVRQLFGVPFGLISALVGPPAGTGTLWQTVLQLLISNIGSILGGAVVYPFSGGVTALLYLDLRIRREGLDVELMRPDAQG